MALTITKAEALPGHVLRLTFSDGTSGDAPMLETIKSFALFKPLEDEAAFQQIRIEDGTVAWANGLDCAVECLYSLAHGLPAPETLEQANENERRRDGRG